MTQSETMTPSLGLGFAPDAAGRRGAVGQSRRTGPRPCVAVRGSPPRCERMNDGSVERGGE